MKRASHRNYVHYLLFLFSQPVLIYKLTTGVNHFQSFCEHTGLQLYINVTVIWWHFVVWQFMYIGVWSCLCRHHTTTYWHEAVCRRPVDWHVCTTASTSYLRDSPCGNAWRRWLQLTVLLCHFYIFGYLYRICGLSLFSSSSWM